MRYRYILCSTASIEDLVCHYRLTGSRNIPPSEVNMIRIQIPDDMQLEKQNGDSYSTTCDSRRIKELDPVMMVKINGHWQEKLGLAKYQPHEVLDIMCTDGYGHLFSGYGYVDKETARKWWAHEIPHFDENGKIPHPGAVIK